MSQAQRGSKVEEQTNLDAYSIAEAMIPSIFQAVGERAAGDPRKRDLLKQSLPLTLVAGAIDLPDYALESYLCDSTLYDPADLTKTFSWVRNFNDFIGPLSPLLGYYNVPAGHTMYVRDVGEEFTVPLTLAIDIVVNIPCVPVIPALADDPVVVVDEIASDIVDYGAELLRGALVKAA